MLTIFYCTFQNHLTQETRSLVHHEALFLDTFLEKRDQRVYGGEICTVHSLYRDQAALDRHKTFTVLLYVMHKYKDICDHRL